VTAAAEALSRDDGRETWGGIAVCLYLIAGRLRDLASGCVDPAHIRPTLRSALHVTACLGALSAAASLAREAWPVRRMTRGLEELLGIGEGSLWAPSWTLTLMDEVTKPARPRAPVPADNAHNPDSVADSLAAMAHDLEEAAEDVDRLIRRTPLSKIAPTGTYMDRMTEEVA
jgi:hypothetical protein